MFEKRTERSKHILQILLIHKPIVVMVDHGESFLEFGDLLLVEHGEDVGVLADCPLFFGALLALGLEVVV